jgi:hypothetical protein
MAADYSGIEGRGIGNSDDRLRGFDAIRLASAL